MFFTAGLRRSVENAERGRVVVGVIVIAKRRVARNTILIGSPSMDANKKSMSVHTEKDRANIL